MRSLNALAATATAAVSRQCGRRGREFRRGTTHSPAIGMGFISRLHQFLLESRRYERALAHIPL